MFGAQNSKLNAAVRITLYLIYGFTVTNILIANMLLGKETLELCK